MLLLVVLVRKRVASGCKTLAINRRLQQNESVNVVMDETERLREDNNALRAENEQLRRENERLRTENTDLLARVPPVPPRAHRAIISVDVLSTYTLSYVDVKDGCKFSVAVTCKAWRDAWRRRCAGTYRLQHTRLSGFNQADSLTLFDGRVMVADYGNQCLTEITSTGERQASWCDGLQFPDACASRGNNMLWVVGLDDKELACVELQPYVNGVSRHLTFTDRDGIEYRPRDIAATGDALLVLFQTDDCWFGRVCVLDLYTGAERYWLVSGSAGQRTDHSHELRGPTRLAVHGDHCFIADTYNQRIAVFNWRQRTFVRSIGRPGAAPSMSDRSGGPVLSYWQRNDNYVDERRGTGPGEFNEPVGVEARGKKLYVSESTGRRIQILRLPGNLSDSPPEILQIIASPRGRLSGLCLDASNRLYCIGNPSDRDRSTHDYLHIFAPCV